MDNNKWNEQNQSYNPYEEPKKDNETKDKKDGMGKKVLKYTSLALVFGLVAGTTFSGSSYLMRNALGNTSITSTAKLTTSGSTISNRKIKATSTSLTGTPTDVSGVVANVMPSIVSITNMSEQQVQNFFGQSGTYQNESAGSGIIVAEDESNLYIATNNHVVEDSKTLTVQFADDTTAKATVKGTDSQRDLAVVQVPLKSLQKDTINAIKVATLGDSSKLNVGDDDIAIGNALGYGQSVTVGVISALNREVSIQDETSGETITNSLIQTDAAINPGNSGGALLNMNGEVIGINSSKYSDTSVEGMGFAIPISTAEPIIQAIISGTSTTTNNAKTGTASLGVYGVDVNDSVSSTYKMPQGVYIAQIVSGSAADKAGLTKGMIITKMDDTKITSMDALKTEIAKHSSGDKVKITVKVQTAGEYKESTITVTLGHK